MVTSLSHVPGIADVPMRSSQPPNRSLSALESSAFRNLAR